MAQNIIYSPWEGTESPWFCLLTTLLLFGLLLTVFLCFHMFSFLWLNLLFDFPTDKKQAEDVGQGNDHTFLGRSFTCWGQVIALIWQSPAFLAPGTNFVEDHFSAARGGKMVSGWFKCLTFTVHFISINITSAPPQSTRHEIPRGRDPCFNSL